MKKCKLCGEWMAFKKHREDHNGQSTIWRCPKCGKEYEKRDKK